MEWNRGPIIGRGSSAAVSLATTSSGELLAVKSTDLSSSSFLQKEQSFLSQLSSPYIVKYMGSDIKYEDRRPRYNLFMEYLPGGTVSDAIKRQGGSLDESMIRVYTYQILQGLNYLHLNNLVHCDIKGQNILLGRDGVKIADLGCAKLLENGVAATSELSGTPVFMAPEVARGEEQGFPADVWALGCTIIEMATGSNPWPELDDPVSALYRIGHSGETPETPRWLSEDAKGFLSKCLKRDAKERWTAKELLEHPFLDKLESDYEKVKEFNWNSPTGVLDQAFWDSFEVSEPSPNPTRLDCSSNSHGQRIRGLIGGICSAGSILPNGTDDEDWITVRENQKEETEEISEQNFDMNSDESRFIPMNFVDFSIVNAQEPESSVDFDYRSAQYSSIQDNSFRTDPMLCCENVTDVTVSRIIHFEEEFNKTLLLLKFIRLQLHVVLLDFSLIYSSNFPSNVDIELEFKR